jgi:hypothetical protein
MSGLENNKKAIAVDSNHKKTPLGLGVNSKGQNLKILSKVWTMRTAQDNPSSPNNQL